MPVISAVKRIKAKKAVALAVQGVPYGEIAPQIGSRGKNGRQIVYAVLQSPAGQQELAKMEAQIKEKYSAEQCISELDDIIKLGYEKKHVPGLVQAVLGKAKVAGLLIDQVKDVTEPVSKDLLDKRAKDSLSQLQVSAEGIEAQAETVEAKTK